MDLIYLRDFFAQYSLPTLIIAIVVAICTFLINKFLAKSLPAIFRSYIPFLMAVLLYIAYDMIFVAHAFTITINSCYAGLLSGSLSILITEICIRISKGKPLSLSTTAMLISSLIRGYVSEKNLSSTALALEKLFKENKDSAPIDKVTKVISKNAEPILDDEEIESLARLIITSVSSMDKTE